MSWNPKRLFLFFASKVNTKNASKSGHDTKSYKFFMLKCWTRTGRKTRALCTCMVDNLHIHERKISNFTNFSF